jgi:hypothetical protein
LVLDDSRLEDTALAELPGAAELRDVLEHISDAVSDSAE